MLKTFDEVLYLSLHIFSNDARFIGVHNGNSESDIRTLLEKPNRCFIVYVSEGCFYAVTIDEHYIVTIFKPFVNVGQAIESLSETLMNDGFLVECDFLTYTALEKDDFAHCAMACIKYLQMSYSHCLKDLSYEEKYRLIFPEAFPQKGEELELFIDELRKSSDELMLVD